ncbi:MAG: enoyl-CoA hydratase/isomerase family protein [Rhodobacter sp.]|nr:enoyl-CoA hydratase/isomerase family protein [Rhodobacter sp.]
MFALSEVANGVAEIRIDRADMDLNVMDQDAVAEFAGVIDRIAADDLIRAVLVTSAKKTFVAGGDLREIVAADTLEKARALVDANRVCLRRLETLGKPVIALINGLALGGGLELAMACTYRIAADTPAVKLGLPEVGLGLIPGAGGTQRTPYLIGTEETLKLALSGRPISAQQALDIGLIDELAPADGLVAAGLAAIEAGVVPATQPWDRHQYTGVLPDPETEDGRAVLGKFLRAVTGRAARNEPAPAAIVAAMRAGLATDMDAGLMIEQDQFAQVVAGPVSKAKIKTAHFGVNAAKSMSMRPRDIPRYEIKRVGVLGAGQMGSGIAHVSAQAGFEVALLDISAEAAEKGKAAIARNCETAIAKGRMSREAADALLARITPVTDYAMLDGADIIVEAVSENETIKHKVLAAAAARLRPGAPLASNTSTLPITGLAEASPRPEDVIGLHFFSPVDRMPFVEVIRGEKTTDQTLARSLDFIKAIRKAVIVVRDALGFYTSRVVGAYTGEALTLMAEGVDPVQVDKVALAAGMPLGPLTMADITSLPLMIDLFGSVTGDGTRPGVQGWRAIEAVTRLVNDFGRTSRAGGGGIYDYVDGKPLPWPGLADAFPPRTERMPDEVVEKRLMYAQALEAARLIEDGVVATPTDADVGSVLGWAFPTWTGGVASYIDMVGAAKFVADCDELRAEFGDRFTVPQIVRDAAARGERFNPA